MNISPARAAAFHVLMRVAASAAHSDDLLHSLGVNTLSAEDRNLTTALVLGVLRWQGYLDTVLRPMLQRPDAEIHAAAWLSLRLGLFQLLFLDRIPAHAALNESVELARANGAAHAAGMVNAILRRALREKATLTRKPLAQRETPAELAHPAWLIARWKKTFGGTVTRSIAEYGQREPGSSSFFASRDGIPVMDDGSRLVAELASAAHASPRRILDCCAAPGGKTAVLALRHPEAEIVAADVSEKRLAAMRRRMDRDPRTAQVRTVLLDMTQPGDAIDGAFDLILCDAPCSGTGTLARNPEIRHRLRESDLQRHAERQRAILTQALRLLAPSGRLVYSTCSLEQEENEAVVLAAAETAVSEPLELLLPAVESLTTEGREELLRSAVHKGSLRTLPGVVAMDGFYAALLAKPT